jgi:hypothetical protein
MFAVPPSVIDSGKSRVEVIEGDSVVIACPAMDAVPPPEIQWFKVRVWIIHLPCGFGMDVANSVTYSPTSPSTRNPVV